jgi:hypothetical protein
MSDDFDVDALKINGKLSTDKRPRRRRTKEYFARIPHKRGLELYKHLGGAAWAVLIEIDRQILKRGKNPIRLTNQNLEKVGMTRSTKSKALRQLHKAGVIILDQQGHGAALVTHLWFPRR